MFIFVARKGFEHQLLHHPLLDGTIFWDIHDVVCAIEETDGDVLVFLSIPHPERVQPVENAAFMSVAIPGSVLIIDTQPLWTPQTLSQLIEEHSIPVEELLYQAARLGQLEAVQYLGPLASQSELNSAVLAGMDGYIELLQTFEFPASRLVRDMIHPRWCQLFRDLFQMITYVDINPQSFVLDAISTYNTPLVQFLIEEQKFEVNLHSAIVEASEQPNNAEIVLYLLDRVGGQFPNMRTAWKTVLSAHMHTFEPLQEGSDSILAEVIEQVGDVAAVYYILNVQPPRDLDTLAALAVMHNRPLIAYRLIQMGANVLDPNWEVLARVLRRQPVHPDEFHIFLVENAVFLDDVNLACSLIEQGCPFDLEKCVQLAELNMNNYLVLFFLMRGARLDTLKMPHYWSLLLESCADPRAFKMKMG
jgi:hypothetical protein